MKDKGQSRHRGTEGGAREPPGEGDSAQQLCGQDHTDRMPALPISGTPGMERTERDRQALGLSGGWEGSTPGARRRWSAQGDASTKQRGGAQRAPCAGQLLTPRVVSEAAQNKHMLTAGQGSLCCLVHSAPSGPACKKQTNPAYSQPLGTEL